MCVVISLNQLKRSAIETVTFCCVSGTWEGKEGWNSGLI